MVGSVIQEARLGRRLSLGALADRTGVSKATLSRWETGKSRPNVCELLPVLETLGVSETAQRVCLQSLGTPQAQRFLAESALEDAPLPVSGGELLRALRMRAGLSQTDAARVVGVTQSLLSRWEYNDCWPDPETLTLLCDVFRATPGERRGLQTRAWKSQEALPRDRDALDRIRFQISILSHEFEHDLYYLALASRYQTLYKSHHIDRADALTVNGYFGNYLAWHDRLDDAYRVSLPLVEEVRRTSHVLNYGQFMAVSAVALAMSAQGRPQKAVETLQAIEGRLGERARSAFHEDLADLSHRAGQTTRAYRHFERSVETAFDEHNQAYCRLRFGELLCLTGKPRAALEQAERARIDRENAHSLIQIDLVRGGALALLGAVNEAGAFLERARRRLQVTPYPGLDAFDKRLRALCPSA